MLLKNTQAASSHTLPCNDRKTFGAVYSNGEGTIECVTFMSELLDSGYIYAPTFINGAVELEESDEPILVHVHYVLRQQSSGLYWPYVTHISFDRGETYFDNTSPWSPDSL